MTKNIVFKNPRKLKKYAETITIGSEEIKTRMNSSTVRKRISDWRNYDFDQQMGGYDYSDFVNWGAEGGRPKIYDSESEKKQAYRLRKKLKEGGELSNKQIEWLKQKGLDVKSNNKLAGVK
jgi:hypothetical protein